MLKTPFIAHQRKIGAVVAFALAATALGGAAAMPSVAAAQDCGTAQTVGALGGAGLGAAAGSNLALGGGRTGGAIIGGVLGALVGAGAGRGISGCDRAPAQTYYAPPPQGQYSQGQYAAPQGYYNGAPPPPPAQAYYEPAYGAPPPPPAYYAEGPVYGGPAYYGPAVVVAPGPYYYHGRYWRHRWW